MSYLPIPFSGSFYSSIDSEPLAGAAPTITIRNSAGVAVVTGAACTEYTAEGESFYLYVYTPTTDSTFTGIMSTAHADAIQSWMLVGSEASFDPEANGLTAAEVWGYNPRTLTSPTLVFDSPWTPGSQNITLVRADSYTDADARAIQFTISLPTDLTNADITLEMRSLDAPDDVISFDGTATNTSGNEWDIKVELTTLDTVGLNTRQRGPGPTYTAAFIATFNGETPVRRVTLLKNVNVTVDRTPGNL